jgi:hypothetical protein
MPILSGMNNWAVMLHVGWKRDVYPQINRKTQSVTIVN